jgi:hypothetical protein
MKIKFVNQPDPVRIMKILADLMTDESGGEYIYEVCKDGKPIIEDESNQKEADIKNENDVEKEKETEMV